MSIRFQCVSCNKSLVVHDRFANRQLKCPGCSIQQTVPARSAVEEPEEEVVVPEVVREPAAPVVAQPIQPMVVQGESAFGSDVAELSSKQSAQPTGLDGLEEEPKPRHRHESKHEEEEDLEWDITPMVDVAFLLLIFFMLTASFSIQKAIPTTAEEQDKPSKNSIQREKSDQPDSFVVQIDEYNGYTIVTGDGTTLDASSKQELIVALKDLKLQMGEATPRVILQAHVLSQHGAVVSCMDAAREAGFESFQMQSVEEFD